MVLVKLEKTAKTSLQDVAGEIRQLLSCTSVHILLGCSVAAFRHTLLERISSASLTIVAESGEFAVTSLLCYEQVRALCDIAIQRGRLSALHVDYWHAKHISSIAVMPVAGPEGVLGLLLLTDTLPNAFGQGERLLLQRILPNVALTLEQEAEYRVTAAAHSAKVIEKNEFLSMLSHELRAPLTAIKGYAILLQAYSIAGLPDEQTIKEASRETDFTGRTETVAMTPTRQREYLDIIIEQTGHLEVLIQDLLDISRLQNGQLSLRSARVDVARLCRRALQLVQQRAEMQSPGRYTFHCDIDAHLPPFWTDAHRIQQILTNLLENAIKYSPEGGLIELHAYFHTIAPASIARANIQPPMADMLAITVRDHGIGIPLHQQDRLFQPFSRIEHPLTRDVPGMGLGLYISCQLVEALGGTITMQSSEGHGTSFTVQFPFQLPSTSRQSARD